MTSTHGALYCQLSWRIATNLESPLLYYAPSVLSVRNKQSYENLVEDIMEIGRHCAALPLLDAHSPDEIMGYNEHGLPRPVLPTGALTIYPLSQSDL